MREGTPRFLFPLEGNYTDVDERRRSIGLPSLAEDLAHAFSPIIPYGPGRTTPVNPYQPTRGRTPAAGTGPGVDLTVPWRPGGIPVYLAATLRHRHDVLALRDRLPAPLYSTSRWLEIDPLTRPSCQFDAGIALNRMAARVCVEDVRRSRVVIAMGLSRRSAGLSVEMGLALAAGIPVVYVGEPACSFDMLPEIVIVPDIDAALAEAGRLAVA